MVILHVACIKNNPFSGVSVVVPQYINEQSKFIQVALLNIRNEKITDVVTQFQFKTGLKIQQLPSPFNKPDLVVFQECYRKEYLGIAANLRNSNIPYVIIPHGELREESQREKRIKKKIANILLFNKFINGAIAVQCLSKEEMLHTMFGKKKILCANGVTIPKKEKCKNEREGIVFLFIGRIDIYVKGLDLLIDAVKSEENFLRSEKCVIKIFGPDVKGRGNQLRGLINNADVLDIINYYGPISGEDKEKEILKSDVFILTSRHEGMPMGILEASSYALPCLVTRGTSMGEWVEDNNAGWVANNSKESIKVQLLNAISEKEDCGKKGRNARIAVERDYSWNSITKKTLEIYNSLIRYNNL